MSEQMIKRMRAWMGKSTQRVPEGRPFHLSKAAASVKMCFFFQAVCSLIISVQGTKAGSVTSGKVHDMDVWCWEEMAGNNLTWPQRVKLHGVGALQRLRKKTGRSRVTNMS